MIDDESGLRAAFSLRRRNAGQDEVVGARRRIAIDADHRLRAVVDARLHARRRLLDAALLLPLAVPTYVVAYAYLDLMHPLGPVQTGLRTLLGLRSPRDPRLRCRSDSRTASMPCSAIFFAR